MVVKSLHMENRVKKISKDIVVASLLLALFADTKVLNYIFSVAIPSMEGILMTTMYGVVVVGLFICGLFAQKRSLFSLRPSHIIICLLCFLWYLMTSALIAPPSVSFPFFAIFTVAAFLIPGIIKIDIRLFLLSLLILPSIGFLYIDKIIYASILEEGVLSMGICYAMLVPVLANLVFLRFFFFHESLKIKLLILPFTIINIFYLIQMAMFGSRGPMFCVLLLLVSFSLIKIERRKFFLLRNRVIIMIILIIFISLSFKPILLLLSDFLLSHYDISLNVIDKFLLKDEQGDITNGRTPILEVALDAISISPIFGYGTAQFEKNTGIIYPHNFIIQMLYDGGIFLTSCIFIPIIKVINYKIKTIQIEEFICLLFLFFASVPASMFSGDLWQAYRLWLFFGFLFSKHSVVVNKTF